MGQRLTESLIRRLEPPARGNRITYDDGVAGLGLRITAAGAKAFVLTYRINGRQRRLTVGSWPDWTATAAREKAKELKRQIDNGDDPLAEREQARRDPTFGDLWELYYRIKASKQKQASSIAA